MPTSTVRMTYASWVSTGERSRSDDLRTVQMAAQLLSLLLRIRFF